MIIEKRSAIFENVFVHMSCAKSMLNRRKDTRNCVYQIYLAIDDDEDEI
jgi:hypothetical protein